MWTRHLNVRTIIVGASLDTFDANPQIIEGAFVHIAKASRGDRQTAGSQGLR